MGVLHIDISRLSTHISRTPIYDRLNLSQRCTAAGSKVRCVLERKMPNGVP